MIRRKSASLTSLLVLLTVFVSLLPPVVAGRPAASYVPGATLVPLGPRQEDVRAAYRAAFHHLYVDAGRLYWSAAEVSGTVRPGDLLVPAGESWDCAPFGGCTSLPLTGTLPLPRAYALQPGPVAVFRTTVVIGGAGGEVAAGWELADVRQALDGYLFGDLPYQVLDEAAIAAGNLQAVSLLVVPAIRADAALSVTQALDAAGALAALRDFVANGGALYAQSTGAIVAEAAGLLPPGTVDLDTSIVLDPGADPNQGLLAVQSPDSPLATSWLTDSLYILGGDPWLHPDGSMEVVATLSNGGDAPAVVRAPYGRGQVLLVAGHPTDASRRAQMPLFLNAVFLALSAQGELYGDAIQTLNPDYDPHEFPAYEVVPVSATLVAAGLWDEPLAGVRITETVSAGYRVLSSTISPIPAAFTATAPTSPTVIVWQLDALEPGVPVTLTYVAETITNVLRAGWGIFSTGTMRYTDTAGVAHTVAHRPFPLTARMSARLSGDRDLEADRHFFLPDTGIFLDVALPLENKEESLADPVTVTDWIYQIVPIADYYDQRDILETDDGETIWVLNEPFLWDTSLYPTPTQMTSPTQTLFTLDDWQGDWCVFTCPGGIYTDPPPGEALPRNVITIPTTYTRYISVTADHELLLPCLPLTFRLGPWPGYHYEEPAVRYGVRSRELLGRTVVFQGTPREGVVVLPNDAGSVYVAAGNDPVPFRRLLDPGIPYAAQPPAPAEVTYTDIWSRTHSLPLRAIFYDVWNWDSCAGCAGPYDQHAAAQVTFGLWIDRDGDGIFEAPVPELSTRLSQTQIVWLSKTYSRGPSSLPIPAGDSVLDFPIFHGLGIQIAPSGETWWDSWVSLNDHTTMVAVTPTAAYDHLYFQQDIPPGDQEIFVVTGTISTYDINREGIFKVDDGVRLVYRQEAAGENRFEVYDSHVHGVLGHSSDGRIEKQVGPTKVSVYGDSIYYLLSFGDPYDPRRFKEDPYLVGWGYGDFVATTYVGGREEMELLHSIVGSGERTRLRVALENNTGFTLTNVALSVSMPPWITATLLYTDTENLPEPLWPELAFLSLTTIPDAWHSVYYFDLQIGQVPAELAGTVTTLPISLQAGNLPAGYAVPPARLGLKENPEVVYGPAHGLVLTDTVPEMVRLEEAAIITAGQSAALLAATDWDAGHPLSDTAGAVFDTFALTIPWAMKNGVVTFTLPAAYTWMPVESPPIIAVSAVLTRTRHGPNRVNEGATICYSDTLDLRWCETSAEAVVEAAGAVLQADYACVGGDGVTPYPDGSCEIPAGRASAVRIAVTPYNEGDAIAQGVWLTLTIPFDVLPISATPPWDWQAGNVLGWRVGDVAPGSRRTMEVTLLVLPDRGAHWSLAILYSDGAFRDDYSDLWVSGRLGEEFAVRVGGGTWLTYLPLVTHRTAAAPDLVVERLAATGGNVTVVLRNVGDAPVYVGEAFWVDVYVNPATPPTQVNQIWTDLGPEGLVWGVTAPALPLAPGQAVTLTVGDGYFYPEYSYVAWPLPAGTPVYAQVDSYNPATTYGAVQEGHEIVGAPYNNISGPVYSQPGEGLPPTGGHPPDAGSNLPGR